MASTQDIRKNLKMLVDGTPYVCLEAQFVKPGKGQAFSRCRLKNLVTGNVIERTYKSGETVEVADIEQRKMTYIYPEGDTYVFMNQATGDQIHVTTESIGDEKRFLIDGLEVEVMLFNGNPIGVELPAHVVIQVATSEPGIKGDTASGASKPATLSTGTTINVPLFINEGEWIKVDTRTGDYLERVNRR
jgi:elongation factor P